MAVIVIWALPKLIHFNKNVKCLWKIDCFLFNKNILVRVIGRLVLKISVNRDYKQTCENSGIDSPKINPGTEVGTIVDVNCPLDNHCLGIVLVEFGSQSKTDLPDHSFPIGWCWVTCCYFVQAFLSWLLLMSLSRSWFAGENKWDTFLLLKSLSSIWTAASKTNGTSD